MKLISILTVFLFGLIKPVYNLRGNYDKNVYLTKNLSESDSTLDIVAVGDIMLGSNFPDHIGLPPNNGKSLLEQANILISRATVSFGNLEGTFLDKGGKPKGSGQNIYNFRQPTSYAQLLHESGFDLLSIANNHINDFGKLGIESTIAILQQYGLEFAGTSSKPYCVINKNNMKIGMLAFAPHAGCNNMLDISNAIRLVKEVKSKVNILIVSFHGGAEGAGYSHVTRRGEIFFNQNRGNVYSFAHSMVDAGADVILGHGPHVPRALELYKSKMIAYSLGNFCTYGKFKLNGITGYAPMLQLIINYHGDFKNGRIISFLQEGEGGAKIDPQNKAAALIAKLSRDDFPESRIQFSVDGKISIVK